MFCPKCNAQLPEGMNFCLQCGERIEYPVPESTVGKTTVLDPSMLEPAVEQPAVEQPPIQDPVFEEPAFQLNLEGAVPQTPEKKKMSKKKKKLLTGIIAGVTAFAILLVGLLGFFAWDWGLYVRDFFERMKAPEEYKDLVEQRALGDSSISELGAVKKILLRYYGAITEAEPVNGAKAGAQVLVGDGLKDLAGQLDKLGAGSGEEVKTLIELIQLLDKIDLQMDCQVEDAALQVMLDLGINNQELLSGQVTLKDGKLYVQLPGLAEQAAEMDMKELGVDPEMFAVIPQILEASEAFKEDLPSQEAVSELLDRCLLAAMGKITQVERENGTIKAGGVSQDVTVLTYEIDEKTAVNMGIALLKEAEKDKTLQQLLQAYSTYAESLKQVMIEAGMKDVAEEYPAVDPDAAMQAIAEARAELESYEAEGEDLLAIETYVNKKGQIVGRKIRPEEDEGEISYMIAVQGRKVGFELLLDADDQKIQLDGSAIYQKGKLNGTGELNVAGQEMLKLSLKDFDVQTLTGTISVGLGKQLQKLLEEEMGAAALVLSSDLSLDITIEQKACTVWLMMGGDQILGIGMDYNTRKEASVSVPENTTTDVEKWGESLDPQVLMDRLEKIGVTEEMLELLSDLLQELDLGEIEAGTAEAIV